MLDETATSLHANICSPLCLAATVLRYETHRRDSCSRLSPPPYTNQIYARLKSSLRFRVLVIKKNFLTQVWFAYGDSLGSVVGGEEAGVDPDGVAVRQAVEVSHVPLSQRRIQHHLKNQTPPITLAMKTQLGVRNSECCIYRRRTLGTPQAVAMACAVSAARRRSEEYTAAGLASPASRRATFYTDSFIHSDSEFSSN